MLIPILALLVTCGLFYSTLNLRKFVHNSVIPLMRRTKKTPGENG